MTDNPHTDVPEEDLLAGEYVLRVLDADETRAAERRMNTDTAFRSLVHMWEAHFAGLSEDIQPIAPPASLKSRIMRAIGPRSAPRRRGWGLFAALALAAAVAIAVFLPDLRGPAPALPGYEAALVSESGDLVINAGFVAEDNLLILTRAQGGARPGRALELWLIADGASAPVSLGVLPDREEARVVVAPDVAAAVPGGTLAISDEPLGGSTTGAPTGDVLAAAPVTPL